MGKDKFSVLLLSVDTSYGKNLTRAKQSAVKIFDRNKVTWPNVWLPDGWNDSMKLFNIGGYGTTLIDADGIVRGINVREAELEKLLDRMFKEERTGPSH